MEAWRGGLGAIEAVARTILCDEDRAVLQTDDPGAIGLAAYTSGMGPLLGYWIEEGRVQADAEAASVLSHHLLHGRLRLSRLREIAARVTASMLENGLEPTLIKGMQTAFEYFPEPAIRPMSDIDILLPADQVGEGDRLLQRLRYEIAPGPRPTHSTSWVRQSEGLLPRSVWFTHAGDPISIDLHRTLDREMAGGPVLRLSPIVGEVKGRPHSSHFPARVLPQPLLTLHLATHASARHSLTLIRLFELVLVVRQDVARGLLDWGELLAATRQARALRFAYPALEMAERLAPGTLPSDLLAEFRAAATPRTRRIVSQLTPGLATRLDNPSIAEQFMWAGSTAEVIAGVGRYLRRSAGWYSPLRVAALAAQRAWSLVKGSLRRG